MRWLFWMVALVGTLTLAGCGDHDDSDNSWRTTDSSNSGAVIVGAFALSPASNMNVLAGSLQVSEPEVINLHGPYAEISVVNGEYSVNFGSFVSGPGIVRDGNVVRVRHTAAAAPLQTVTTTLTIGDKSANFSSTTGSTPPNLAINVTGEGFYLNVPPSVTHLFGPVLITMSPGFEVPISITGGEYSVNGGPFTTTPGSVQNNDEILIRHVSADGVNDTTVITMASIGDFKFPFTSSTASVATQTISVTAAPSTLVFAEVPVLSSGTQTVQVEEYFALFSFDNETFYDIPPQTRFLQAGQLLYLSDVAPGVIGQSYTSIIRIGDKQRVLFKVTAG